MTAAPQYDVSQFEDAEGDRSSNIMVLHRNAYNTDNGFHSLPPNYTAPSTILLVRTTPIPTVTATRSTYPPALGYGVIRRESNDSNLTVSTLGFPEQQEVTTGIRAEDRNENDVLFGRGKGSNNYIGNQRFRQIVNQYREHYFETRRTEKPLLARRVMDLIRNQVPSGRFLQFDSITGKYFEVSEEVAVRKTSQSLREGKLQRQKNKEAETHVLPKKSSISGPLKKRRLSDENTTFEGDQIVTRKKVTSERNAVQRFEESVAPTVSVPFPCARQQLPLIQSDSTSGSSVQHLRNLISRRYNQMQKEQK